ncbi:hypothetical protein FHX80_11170 [Streptomyces brevispora]|uniref:Uncharacterized protein n=1 Tax=Streptomyces brevispora TaxID=887462 RepID=A0A561UR28_9ACTN|nr:hypothetical protein FHX80_11170 [Streptomyces brevispora]
MRTTRSGRTTPFHTASFRTTSFRITPFRSAALRAVAFRLAAASTCPHRMVGAAASARPVHPVPKTVRSKERPS